MSASGRQSYAIVCALFVLYGVAFAMLIPSLPLLALKINHGDAARSSMLYGLASFTRYALEFFSAPLLGSLADVKGRKSVLTLAFLVTAAELVLLAIFPSITMVFFTRAMSGLGDSAVATSYAIVTDIALHNGDVVSQQYSLLAAMTGVGFIVGPYIGGLLCQIDISVCFAAAALIAAAGALACWLLLEETGALLTAPASGAAPSLNPIVGLRMHMSNPKLRQYVLPFFLCAMNTGTAFLWYLYMAARFQSSPASVGMFLSFHGLVNAVVLGVVVQHVVPRLLGEQDAALLSLLACALHMLCNGLCTQEYQLYLAAIVFGLGAAYLPALKSVIVHESMGHQDGAAFLANLQGAISSVRTLATAVGSLFYSALFSLGVSMQPVAFPQISFLVAGGVYMAAWLLLRAVFAEHGASEGVQAKNEVRRGGLGEGTELLGLELCDCEGQPPLYKIRERYGSLATGDLLSVIG